MRMMMPLADQSETSRPSCGVKIQPSLLLSAYIQLAKRFNIRKYNTAVLILGEFIRIQTKCRTRGKTEQDREKDRARQGIRQSKTGSKTEQDRE